MSKRKSKGRNNLHLLDAQQREALSTFQKDFKTALPAMAGLAETAKQVHRNMIGATQWQIIENQKPDAPVPEQQPWSVGHAKVNYVDHIEGVEE